MTVFFFFLASVAGMIWAVREDQPVWLTIFVLLFAFALVSWAAEDEG